MDDWRERQGPLLIEQGELPPSPEVLSTTLGEMLGGERDISLILLNSPGYGEGITIQAKDSVLSYFQDGSAHGRAFIVWDGVDGNAKQIQSQGLGSIDLTRNASMAGFGLEVLFNENPIQIALVVFTGKDRVSEMTLEVPSRIRNKMTLVFPFTGFKATSGAGADFSQAGALLLFIGSSDTHIGFADIKFGPLIGLLDGDGDGMPDLTDLDDDNDSLPDSLENGSGVFNGPQDPGTSPLNADSDTDGMGDGFELDNNFNPLQNDEDTNGVADGDDDADTDGLVNKEEQRHGTKPRDADTDDDGIQDGKEIQVGLDPKTPNVVDLSVIKSGSRPYAKIGEEIVFFIDVTNRGNADAMEVQVMDILPPSVTLSSSTPTGQLEGSLLKVPLGTLKAGESRRVLVQVRVIGPVGLQVPNNACVSSLQKDSNMNDNCSATPLSVLSHFADVEITVRALKTQTRPGHEVVFVVTVQNKGSDSAENVRATVGFPSKLELTSTSDPAWAIANQTVTANLGSLPPFAGRSVTILTRVRMDFPVPAGLDLGVLGEVTHTTPDPDETNNQSYVTLQVTPPLSTKITDANTNFHRLVVRGFEPWQYYYFYLQAYSRDGDVDELTGDLLTGENQAAGSTYRELDQPLKAQLKTAIDSLKLIAKPGEEVTLVFIGHGNDETADANQDEPQAEGLDKDETFWLNFSEGDLSDDELAILVNGFNDSVTVTIYFDACYAGGFTDGATDIKERDNLTVIGATGLVPLDPPIHFGGLLETMTEELADGAGEGDADANGDGVVTSQEMKDFLTDDGWDIGPPPLPNQNRMAKISLSSKPLSGKSSCGDMQTGICQFLPAFDVVVNRDNGYQLTVNGVNYGAQAIIQFYLIDTNLDSLLVATSQSTFDGTFTEKFALPPSFDEEADYLLLISDDQGRYDWWPLGRFINQSPGSFTRLSPVDSSVVSNQSLSFFWSRSDDDSPVTYTLRIAAAGWDTTIAVADTTLTLSGEAFQFAGGNLNWSVQATDGEKTTLALNGGGFFIWSPSTHVAPVTAGVLNKMILHPAFPNPFNPFTTIRFELTGNSKGRLTVANLQGQTVRTVWAGWAEAGVHTVVWDGRDDAGQAVGSGIYLYKLEAAGLYQVRTMLLLK